MVKKTENYPFLVDKGGSSTVDKQWGDGRHRWIKKILNVNIINFEKVDKPKGGGWVGQCG